MNTEIMLTAETGVISEIGVYAGTGVKAGARWWGI